MNSFIITSLSAAAWLPGPDDSHYTVTLDSDGDLVERFYPDPEDNEPDIDRQSVVASGLSAPGYATYLHDSYSSDTSQRILYFQTDGAICEYRCDDSDSWEEGRIEFSTDVQVHKNSQLAAVFTIDDQKHNLFFQDQDGTIRLAQRDARDDGSGVWKVVSKPVVPYVMEGSPISVSVVDLNADSFVFYIRTIVDGVIVENTFGKAIKTADATPVLGVEQIEDVRSLFVVLSEDGPVTAYYVLTPEGSVKMYTREGDAWEEVDMGTIDEDGEYSPSGAEQGYTDLASHLKASVKQGLKDLKAAKAGK